MPVRNATLDILLNVETAQARRQLRQYDRDWSRFSKNIGDTAARVGKAVALGVAAATAAYIASTKQLSDLGDEIARQAANAGTSATEFQVLATTLKTFNIEAMQTAGLVQTITERIGQAHVGSVEWRRVFNSLNLEVSELRRLSPAEQFREVAAALQGVDANTRVEAIRRLGSGWEQLGSISQGVLDEMERRLIAVGGVIREDSVQALSESAASLVLYGDSIRAAFADAFVSFNREIGLTTSNFDEFVGSINGFIRGAGVVLGRVINATREFFVEYRQELITGLAVYVAWKAALLGVAAYHAARAAVAGLIVLFTNLRRVLTSTLARVVLIPAAIVGAGIALGAVVRGFRNAASR